MKKILINGNFFCRNLTGIERFAYEITLRLDSLAQKGEFAMLIPSNAEASKIPSYKNIQIIKSSKSCRIFPVWEHIHFSAAAKKMKAITLDFANATPVLYPGAVFIHDIYARLYKQDFTSMKDKIIRLYDCFMYRNAAKRAKQLITVSEFSRSQISRTYKVPEEKIEVIYNGWEHFKSIKADESVFENFTQLKKGKFFFTLGSLSLRKNLKWIADYAQAHQESMFAVSGKCISALVPKELSSLQTLKNVVLLGYVSDGQVKALMQNCKAFIFPSYYEGFGIPPLEALSCGAKIIISKSACLPEIYGNAAHYIMPDDTNVDLEKLLLQPVSDSKPVLEKFLYDKSAEKLYDILKMRF